MRHRKEKRPLGRTGSHREALLRNLVTSLLEHGRIRTTLPKAKELRRVADRMITLGKRGGLAARRQVLRTVKSEGVARKLFSEIALRFEGRPGGYTRILHLGTRPGDGASMALIELTALAKPAEEAPGKGAKGKKAKASPKGKAAPKAPAKEAKPARRKAAAKEGSSS